MPDTKNILIVAAERGLGLGLAREYFRRGWNVFATTFPGSDTAALTGLGQSDPSRLSVITEIDITDPACPDRLDAALGERRFDILFQNAGIWGPMHQSTLEVTPAEAEKLFLTNAIAPVRLVRRLLHRLPEGRGSVCFMTSLRGSVAENVEGRMDLYRASKAALNSLTRGLFVEEIALKGRTLLNLHPGWVTTEMGTLGGTLQAEIDVDTSVRGLAEVIGQYADQGGHHFVDYQGKKIAW